jgi:hypothetical protein
MSKESNQKPVNNLDKWFYSFFRKNNENYSLQLLNLDRLEKLQEMRKGKINKS